MFTAASPHPAVEELDPLVGFIPVAGPPAVLLVGPLVLLGLLVAGPFVAMLTIAAVLVLAIAVVAAAGLIVASPYLLIRHLRARHAAAPVPAPAPAGRVARSLIPATSRRAVA
jgi:hypothetical protein